MARYPNERWLTYLIAHAGLGDKDVVELSELHSFLPPDSQALKRIRKEIQRNKEALKKATRPAKYALAKRLKIRGLAAKDQVSKVVTEHMSCRSARPALEYLLTARADHGDIARLVTERTGRATSAEHVSLYAHYFWDLSFLSERRTYDFFDEHPRGADLLGCFLQGADYALWKLGSPREMGQTEILNKVLQESAMRFLETHHMEANRNTAMTAKFWAENIFKATEELNKTGDPIAQVIDEIRNVSLRLGRRKISSLEDLKNRE